MTSYPELIEDVGKGKVVVNQLTANMAGSPRVRTDTKTK